MSDVNQEKNIKNREFTMLNSIIAIRDKSNQCTFRLSSMIDNKLLVTSTSLSRENYPNYNRIYIDKGTLLAKRPNSINADWRTKSTSQHEFLNLHAYKFLSFINCKRVTKKKIELLDCILANLISSSASSSQLLYSRCSANNPNYRTIIQITDYLEQNELIINVIGKSNQYERNQSYMIPTALFDFEVKKANVRVELQKNHSMIEVRNEKGKPLSLSRIKERNVIAFKDASEPVRRYNALWLNHNAKLDGRLLVPFCRRIFNRDLSHGGRFYGGGHLMLPKLDRSRILIDGENTIEPDFKSLHYSLLYAMKGIELNPFCDDPYSITGFDRKTIKLTSLVLLNSENLSRFKANVTKSAKPQNKAIMARYRDDYNQFIIQKNKGLYARPPVKPQLARGFITGIPEHTNGNDLLNAILERHSPISGLLGTKNIGTKLQNIDSNIMSEILNQLATLDIPVLPVHDSLRCRVSDLAVVISVMKKAYKKITNFEGYVDCDDIECHPISQ